MLFDDDDTGRDDDSHPNPQSVSSAGLPPPRENPSCMGHDDVEAMLVQLAKAGTLPHAMIFAGQEGTGKATMAFRFARHLLSSRSGQGEQDAPMLFMPALEPASAAEHGLDVAANDPVFRQVASGGHPDLLVIERPYDEKKDRRKDSIDIESTRKIAPFMRMTPSREGGWRVVIVDDADTMNRQAQNAILKILEEPPRRAVLILVAHRPGAMIPTIRSRCRVMNFRPMTQAVFSALAGRLDASLDREGVMTLFALTRGSIGQAQAVVEEGGLESLDKLTALLAHWPQWDWPAIHALADSVGRAGQDEQYRMIETLMLWIAETLVRVKAGAATLPEMLNRAKNLLNSHSLAAWTALFEQLTDHFEKIRFANLDKRQGIIGAFTILSQNA